MQMKFSYTCFFLLFQLSSFLFSSQQPFQGGSSYPYLSGYTWVSFCDWRLLSKDYGAAPEGFPPEEVSLGDIIFLDLACAEEFARDYLPQIKYPVIVISANYGYLADAPMPGPSDFLLQEEKIAAWFVQNLDRESSDKLFPLPIGLANRYWPHGNTDLLDHFIPLSLTKNTKSHFTYLNFTYRPEREDCIHYFQKIGAKFTQPSSFKSYLQDLSKTVFVVSPPGNGLDCHRTWEALLMGCYPIVKSSTLNPLYEGLPVVCINSWDEVTEEFLQKKYHELKSKSCSRETLYAPYWFQKIKTAQETLRREFLSQNVTPD